MSTKICELSTGDTVYLYDKSIVVFFDGKRKVLSTSVYNGGYHDDFTAVYNNDAKQGAGMPCEMLADTYTEHMKLVSERLSLDPDKVSGMSTAASMENAVIEKIDFKDLTVTAIVTGGIETNGGRVGDHADYYQPKEKADKFGTINIILVIDSDMPAGTMARALVTCTEAKTAAIQELLEGSKYSTGLATGSGTDQTMIIANPENKLYLEGAGKHCKMGELIGKVVMKAVKAALNKQSGLNPELQHSAMRRLQRFSVTPMKLWLGYKNIDSQTIKPEYLLALEILSVESDMLIYTSLYVHILDQLLWNLLCPQESINAGNDILKLLSEKYNVSFMKINESSISDFIKKWEILFNNIIYKSLHIQGENEHGQAI